MKDIICKMTYIEDQGNSEGAVQRETDLETPADIACVRFIKNDGEVEGKRSLHVSLQEEVVAKVQLRLNEQTKLKVHNLQDGSQKAKASKSPRVASKSRKVSLQRANGRLMLNDVCCCV